jgi:hypothetical protein
MMKVRSIFERKWTWFALLAIWALAGPAYAQQEFNRSFDGATCSGAAPTTLDNGVELAHLSKGGRLAWCQAGDSVLLKATTFFTLEYEPDVASAAVGAGTIYLYRCSMCIDTGNTCKKILVDNDSDGIRDDEPLNGDAGPAEQRRFIYGNGPGCYKLVEDGDNSTDVAFATLTATEGK